MAKLSLFDIGYILIDNIINVKNDNNKTKLLAAIKIHNKDINDTKQEIIKRRNIYLNKYDIHRKNNIDNYDKYLMQKKVLFDKWKQSNKVKDLYDLISLQQPEYIEVNDIYTIYETI